MKHMYSGELESGFDASLWDDYPLAEKADKPRILYLDRFRGERKQRPLSAHAHWEFIGIADGSGELESDRMYELAVNCIILVPPGIEHRENAGGRMEIFWLGFEAEFAPGVQMDAPLTVNSRELVAALADFWRFTVTRQARTGLELEGRLMTLIGGFWREFRARRSDGISRLQQAVTFLQDNFHLPVNMVELASQCDLSESHFYREFKRMTGKTPVNYLTDIRLGQAILYLRETELPVSRIAGLCGFSDPYYFCRVFSRRYGLPPGRFRRGAVP